MKILYAVQATGNGHISRAQQIVPHLQKFAEVDLFLSGSNSQLDLALPVKYRSKGLSFNYSGVGGLNFTKTIKDIKIMNALREARNLPVEKYDLVLNDFEFITSQACRIKKKSSIHFGHQASFYSPNVPRPARKKIIDEWIMNHFVKSTHHLGLHFKSYDKNILPPIIKEEIQSAHGKDKGHITVYLPSFQKHILIHHFRKLPHIKFEWFLSDTKSVTCSKNISFFPINQELFNNSLISCHGIITGAGFETPSEALFMKKRIMAIPIRNHYEQQCNAAALKEYGAYVMNEPGLLFHQDIENWLSKPKPDIDLKANEIHNTIELLLNLSRS